MKTMTCKQLGGACNKEFHAETFEEVVQMSKSHGTEMFESGDEEHLKAMEDMKQLMQDPNAMQKWMEEKQNEFNSILDDN